MDPTEHAEAEMGIGEFLESTRAGVRLPSALIEVILVTLKETFEVESPQGLMGLGAQLVWAAIEERKEAKISSVHGDLFFRWLNDDS